SALDTSQSVLNIEIQLQHIMDWTARRTLQTLGAWTFATEDLQNMKVTPAQEPSNEMPYQRRYYIFGVALCILTTAASQEDFGLGTALTPESWALIEAARQLRCTVSMDREAYF